MNDELGDENPYLFRWRKIYCGFFWFGCYFHRIRKTKKFHHRIYKFNHIKYFCCNLLWFTENMCIILRKFTYTQKPMKDT